MPSFDTSYVTAYASSIHYVFDADAICLRRYDAADDATLP